MQKLTLQMKIPILVPKSSCLAQVKSKTGLFNCWFFFLVKAAAQYNGKHYLEASFILVFRQRRMYKSIKDNLQGVQASFDWPNLLGYPVFKDKKYVCKQNVYPFIYLFFDALFTNKENFKKSWSQTPNKDIGKSWSGFANALIWSLFDFCSRWRLSDFMTKRTKLWVLKIQTWTFGPTWSWVESHDGGNMTVEIPWLWQEQDHGNPMIW